MSGSRGERWMRQMRPMRLKLGPERERRCPVAESFRTEMRTGLASTPLTEVAAQTDAMITDPVYEGKSMAGMMQLIKEGSIAPGSNVLYVHLGGQPALNAYSSYFPHN